MAEDQIPDFSDREAVEAWLETQPREVSIMIAARSALRVLPNLDGLFAADTGIDPPHAVLLPLLCATLVSSCAAVGPHDETLRSAADFAADFADFAGSEAYLVAFVADSDHSAQSAARSARFAALSAALSASFAARSAAYSADSASAAALYSAALSAAEHVKEKTNLHARMERALWSGSKEQDPLATRWTTLRDALTEATGPWDFWIDWYQRHLEGRPQNWPLLRRIALIDEVDWKKGPAHVNAIIAKLKGEFEPAAAQALRQATQDLKAPLEETRLGIGGNFPPEPIETEVTAPPREMSPELLKLLQDMVASITRSQKAIDGLQTEGCRNDARNAEIVAAEAEVVAEEKSRLQSMWEKATDSFAEEIGKELAQLLAKRIPYILAGMGSVYAAAQMLLQTL